MAVVDALRKRGGDGGGSRAPVSKEKLRRAARTALEQIEEALGEGDSKRAKELTGVLRDMAAIRINVDDFPEAFQVLTKHGFRNAQGYKLTQTSTSTDTLMVSPSGFGIVLSQHFKNKP